MQKLYPSHLTENTGSKASATLKEASFIQQFLDLPFILLLTHSINSHVLPLNPEFSFPLNLQKEKNSLFTVIYTKPTTRQELQGRNWLHPVSSLFLCWIPT